MRPGAPVRALRGSLPVWWAEIPGPLDVALHFRVGHADEPLHMAGITHLVEHLVMRAVGRRDHPCNAMVDATECIFFADGEPEEVLEFLGLVAAAVSDLPLADLERERRILEVEARSRLPGVVDRLLEYRYGKAGYGVVAHEEVGLRWVGEAEVRAWCAQHFTGGNAGIWMTAEPPADFALALPDGPARPAPEPRPRPGLPGFIADGYGGVALAGVAPRSHGLTLGAAVAEERLYTRLREEHGLAYAPYTDYRMVGAASAHVVLGTDGRDEDAPRLLAELWRCASELAEHGASEDELDRERRAIARSRREPGTLAGDLSYAVTSELEGRRHVTAEELDGGFAAADGATVAAAMGALLEHALLLGTDGSRPPAGSVTPIEPPPAAPIDGELFQLPRSGVLRRRGGARLWVGERAVRLDDGVAPVTLPWDELALAERRPAGALSLLGVDGEGFTVAPYVWEDGERAVGLIRSRLPDGVLVPAGERTVSDAIDSAVERRIRQPAAVAGPLHELPGELSAAEGLVDLVQAARSKDIEIGLLVLTERRLLWLASLTDDRLVVSLDQLTRAAASYGELELEWEDGRVRFVISPRSVAEELAQRIAA